MVFGNSKLNNFNFLLNNRPLTYSNNHKYLEIEFDNNLNFSDLSKNFFKRIYCQKCKCECYFLFMIINKKEKNLKSLNKV
jgi:hypothetical protein